MDVRRLEGQRNTNDPQVLDFFANRCIVAPTNEAANDINENMLAMLSNKCEEFFSCDSIHGGDANGEHYPVEFLLGHIVDIQIVKIVQHSHRRRTQNDVQIVSGIIRYRGRKI